MSVSAVPMPPRSAGSPRARSRARWVGRRSAYLSTYAQHPEGPSRRSLREGLKATPHRGRRWWLWQERGTLVAANDQGRTIKIPAHMYEELEAFARREGYSLDNAVEKLLWAGIETYHTDRDR